MKTLSFALAAFSSLLFFGLAQAHEPSCLIDLAQGSSFTEHPDSALVSLDLTPQYESALADGAKYSLTPEDALYIQNYTQTLYEWVNNALRTGMKKRYACYIEGLLESLGKLPEYTGLAIRGTNLPTKVLAEHTPGNVVTYAAFTSATAGDTLADNFNDRRIVITILSKHARDIRIFNPEEAEVLFMPGTRFLVVSRHDDTGFLGKTSITLQELD